MGWDWFGTAATAIVGLAGILATAWVSARERRHRRVEDLNSEKRRAYVNLFASIDRVVSAIRHVWFLRKRQADAATVDQAVARLRDLRLEYNTAIYELALSCPTSVLVVAEELRLALKARSQRVEQGAEGDFSVREVRGRLLNVMRADLGYPPLPPDAIDSDSVSALTT